MLRRFSTFRHMLDHSCLYDSAMRLPVVSYSSFVLGRDILQFWEQVAQASFVYADADVSFIIATFARVCQWIFVALLAILPIFRWRPILKSENLLARAGALFTVLLIPMFMLLDRAPPNLALNLVALALGLVSNMMAVVTLSFLGRSFSVMPEARRLVTKGPYAIVRHPLYLCELLGVVAMVLQYRSMAALGLIALICSLQFGRAGWEEAVLARAFSDFAEYRRRTPFLIPNSWRQLSLLCLSEGPIRDRSAAVMLCAITLLVFVLQVLPQRGR